MLLSIRTSGSSFLDNITWYLAVFSCLAFVKLVNITAYISQILLAGKTTYGNLCHTAVNQPVTPPTVTPLSSHTLKQSLLNERSVCRSSSLECTVSQTQIYQVQSDVSWCTILNFY